jgi:hypothetical protein
LFGLREMLKYGAVLDISNHLLMVHPGGQMKSISGGIRAILTKQGYTPVDLTITGGHLHVSAVVNGVPCRLVVDTGASLTVLDRQFARKARLGGYDTGAYARGIGTKARPIRVSQFPELKLGDFVIRNAAVTISDLDQELLGGDGKASAVGLLGAEYLGLHGAVFDFNSGTLYLRPQKSCVGEAPVPRARRDRSVSCGAPIRAHQILCVSSSDSGASWDLFTRR